MRIRDLLERTVQPLDSRSEDDWNRLDLNYNARPQKPGSFDLSYTRITGTAAGAGMDVSPRDMLLLFWDAGGVLVGNLLLELLGDAFYVRLSEVRPSQRSNGYGLGMYLTALHDLGLKIGCDTQLTKGGVAMWIALLRHPDVEVTATKDGEPFDVKPEFLSQLVFDNRENGMQMFARWVGA